MNPDAYFGFLTFYLWVFYDGPTSNILAARNDRRS
jgi:hypothetical protein